MLFMLLILDIPAIYFLLFYSSWGETFFMCIQDIIVVLLVYIYRGNYAAAILFAPVYIGINYALCTPEITPFPVVLKLQEFNMLVLVISRVCI